MSKRDKHDEEPLDAKPTDEQTPEQLREEIESLTAELEDERLRTHEEHDKYLRALADFSNYRRRHQDEYAQAMRFASQELIIKILPAIDNFERGLQAAEQAHSFDSLVDGMKLTLKQLKDILEREGVKKIESEGQQFDPMLHEAVMRVVTDEFPENTIVGEVQPGYMQGDKVIRPARVQVAAAPE